MRAAQLGLAMLVAVTLLGFVPGSARATAMTNFETGPGVHIFDGFPGGPDLGDLLCSCLGSHLPFGGLDGFFDHEGDGWTPPGSSSGLFQSWPGFSTSGDHEWDGGLVNFPFSDHPFDLKFCRVPEPSTALLLLPALLVGLGRRARRA